MKSGGSVSSTGGILRTAVPTPGDEINAESDILKQRQEEKRRRRLLFGRRSLFSAGEQGVRDTLG